MTIRRLAALLLIAFFRDRHVQCAGRRLSESTGHHRGAVRRRRRHRSAGSHNRRPALEQQLGKTLRRRQQARRRHDDRHQLRRQVAARRLHAADGDRARRWRSTSPCTRSCPTIRSPISSRSPAVAQVPFVLVVNPALPVHSVPELIKYAKDNPGKLSFGSSGPGAPHHLFMELFKAMTGTEMTHVPYKGSAAGAQRRGRRPHPR